MGQFLDQLGGELYLPGVGDEMKIAFTDLKGTEIDLAKMQDKRVILVDFWATWVWPLRRRVLRWPAGSGIPWSLLGLRARGFGARHQCGPRPRRCHHARPSRALARGGAVDG